MRVLYLTTDAFGGFGGIAKYNRDLLVALCSNFRCRQVVAFPRHVSEFLGEMPDKLEYRMDGVRGKTSYLVSVICFLLKDRKFDMVVCAHVNLLPISLFCSWIARAKLVLVVYGIDVWQPPKNRLVKLLIDKVDHVVSISRVTMNKLMEWSTVPEEKFFILPNAIDLSEYGVKKKPDYLLSRYGLKGKKVLMTLGRMSAEEKGKGVDRVLQVLPEVSQEEPDLSYLVVGGGSDLNRLKSLADRLGQKDKVVFAGRIPEKEKSDHYHLADAYVMPSSLEGFGFVFLEALASGLPVVASSIDGGREALLEGKLGTLVDPNDKGQIVKAIVEALRRGKRQIPTELESFSLDSFRLKCQRFLDMVKKRNEKGIDK